MVKNCKICLTVAQLIYYKQNHEHICFGILWHGGVIMRCRFHGDGWVLPMKSTLAEISYSNLDMLLASTTIALL